MKKFSFLLIACLITISILIGGCSGMQPKTVNTTNKYPDKPITIIVPFSVGGGLDLVARALEKSAPKYLGQSLVVVNKPGGAGVIGWNELAGANPDGYTVGTAGVEILLQSLYAPMKYDYVTALTPLAQVSTSPLVLAVKSDEPWQTVDDLVRYAQHHPEQLKFGHSGVGSVPHLVGEMFGQATGISIEQVPFQGTGEATIALLGGHVQLIFVNPMLIKEHVKSGKLRVLAIADERRLIDPVLSDVPTLKELGINVALNNWQAIAAPKDIPADVKAKLAEGFKAMINDPEFKRNMEIAGMRVEYLGPRELEEKWLSENQKLSKIVQETGILDLIKAQKK